MPESERKEEVDMAFVWVILVHITIPLLLIYIAAAMRNGHRARVELQALRNAVAMYSETDGARLLGREAKALLALQRQQLVSALDRVRRDRRDALGEAVPVTLVVRDGSVSSPALVRNWFSRARQAHADEEARAAAAVEVRAAVLARAGLLDPFADSRPVPLELDALTRAAAGIQASRDGVLAGENADFVAEGVRSILRDERDLIQIRQYQLIVALIETSPAPSAGSGTTLEEAYAWELHRVVAELEDQECAPLRETWQGLERISATPKLEQHK